MISIHHYHHIVRDPETVRFQEEALGKLSTIITNQEKIMATLDQVLADVTAESTALDSVAALVTGLRQQIADATAGQLPADVQAKIDQIFTAAETNKAKLATALAANVAPANPAPAPKPSSAA